MKTPSLLLLYTKTKSCFRLKVQASIEEDDDAEDDESFWRFASESLKIIFKPSWQTNWVTFATFSQFLVLEEGEMMTAETPRKSRRNRRGSGRKQSSRQRRRGGRSTRSRRTRGRWSGSPSGRRWSSLWNNLFSLNNFQYGLEKPPNDFSDDDDEDDDDSFGLSSKEDQQDSVESKLNFS